MATTTTNTTTEKSNPRGWQVTYSARGETCVIRNLSHKEACNTAQALQNEGWKNVDFKRA